MSVKSLTGARAPIALIVAAVTAVGIGSAGASMITVDVTPSVSEAPLNSTFDVAITADIPKDVVAYGFHFVFDASQLGLASITVAPPFLSLHSSRADGLAALALPTTAVGENVLLATAKFTALSAGDATISIAVTPGDPMEGFAERGTTFADVSVTPAHVTIPAPSGPPPVDPGVPEPTTLMLMAGGFALLYRRRARR